MVEYPKPAEAEMPSTDPSTAQEPTEPPSQGHTDANADTAAPAPTPKIHDDDRSLCIHAYVFAAAAVKDGVPGLRMLACYNFNDLLEGILQDKVSIARPRRLHLHRLHHYLR